MSLQTRIFRRMCSMSDARRDYGLTIPDDIDYRLNIRYGPDKKWQVLDIYRPKNVKGNLPAIVSFHGGGWVYGTKETYRFYCMELARSGFVVINPTYRLAPEHHFPAALTDMNHVFSFLLRNAKKCGADTGRIFGIGDSSGATGIAVYACILSDDEYAARFPFSAPEGLRLRGIGLNCGLYSMNGRLEVMRDVFPKGKESEGLELLHIPAHINKKFPPCFLLTSLGDFNVEEPKHLIPVLEKNGVKYHCSIYGDEQNKPGHIFHCDIRDPQAGAANEEELFFFKSL